MTIITKTISASLVSLSLFIVGCSTVPESAQKVIESKQNAIMEMHTQTAEFNSNNQIEVNVKLPPGTYEIADIEGFEIASVSIPQDMTVASLAAYDAIGRINIPENVAISALRVLSPLAGFGIGAWQNTVTHRSNTDMMKSLGNGMFELNSQFIQDPPVIQPEVVNPVVVEPEVVTTNP